MIESYDRLMATVGFREFRKHLRAYVRRVRNGEEFQITYRGKVVAVLRPPASDVDVDPGLHELVRRGVARQVVANDPDAYPRFNRAIRHTTVQQLVDDERGER